MAKKIRKIIDGKVQWFGGFKSNSVGQLVYTSPMLEITDKDSYLEGYRYNIYNLLNIIKKELPDETYGISGVFGKGTKSEIDIEIQQALRKKLDLTVNSYVSTLKDREYHCKFTVTTPKGYTLNMEV